LNLFSNQREDWHVSTSSRISLLAILALVSGAIHGLVAATDGNGDVVVSTSIVDKAQALATLVP
jgi:hypothetical protein